MEKRMEKRIERIKAHSSAVYRKDSPPKAPRFFVLLSTPSLCGTELFAVTPQGNGRVGRCGPRIEEETILSLFLGWALTLLSSSLSTANLYGRRKKPTTHRERERENIRHSGPMLPG
jgi:hypothetical protein